MLISRSSKTLSNAAFTFKRVAAGCFFLFWSSLVLMSRLTMLSVVDLFFWNPDWVGGNICFCSSHD